MAVLSITAANVFKGSGSTAQNGVAAAATTITQGQALYQLSAGTIGLADANATVAGSNAFIGFALNAASPGQPITFVGTDTAYIPGATLTVGGTVWLDSTTPGAVTQTYADVASGSTVIVLGVATSTTAMNLLPVVGGLKP